MIRTPKQAAKDLALYLGITAAVLIPVLASMLGEWHEKVVATCVGVFLYTGIVFGPFLYKAHAYWLQPRFWFGTLALFAMHCGIMLFLSKQEHVTVWLITPILAIEFGTLDMWADDLAKSATNNLTKSDEGL